MDFWMRLCKKDMKANRPPTMPRMWIKNSLQYFCFLFSTIDSEPAFTRSIVRFSYYLPLGKSMLAFGARAGYIAPILDDLPIDVRFFNGGGTTPTITVDAPALGNDSTPTITLTAEPGAQIRLGSNGVAGGTSGATGELLRVWDSGSLAPAAAGGAMPATGWVKLRSKTGAFAGGETVTLPGGATITISGPGKRSWLHMVGAEVGTLTWARLGDVKWRGDWHELGTTSGADDQTFQSGKVYDAYCVHFPVLMSQAKVMPSSPSSMFST